MRRPSFNPFLDFPFASWLKREPSSGRSGRRKAYVEEGKRAEMVGKALLAKNDHRRVPKVSGDPVLLALHLTEEEVLDRKDYARGAVVVTKDGRKLRYEKGA